MWRIVFQNLHHCISQKTLLHRCLILRHNSLRKSKVVYLQKFKHKTLNAVFSKSGFLIFSTWNGCTSVSFAPIKLRLVPFNFPDNFLWESVNISTFVFFTLWVCFSCRVTIEFWKIGRLKNNKSQLIIYKNAMTKI